MPGPRVEKTRHPEYGNCVRIANETATLYVSLDFGPRILHYSLGDGPNVMFVNRDPEYVKKGEDFDRVFYPGAFWNIYGGNRLWVAPHSFPHAFYPDNGPVDFEILENGARFVPAPRKETGVRIFTEVRLEGATSQVRIGHRVENIGAEALRIAAWSITSVDGGGLEIVPQAGNQTGVLPNRHISLWPYSDMRDGRIAWGSAYISIKQDARIKAPLKIGTNNEDGWACYLNKGQCFLVFYNHETGADYPDFGVSYETYTDDRMLEIETLSPLKYIGPGESVEHSEIWQLFPQEGIADGSDEGQVSAIVASIFPNALIVAPEGNYSGGSAENHRKNP